ncbi:hypothetical protein GH714_004304 [Hevea brasiliensis]|uniref:Uncharacterized protein n=1 Tax=Hevea brasiliensis TaxID=3981 RepID=A0A6A6MAU3_HEVBR|nr:hypothetical protein GH714_004304 [Hevea brasiliensis]
MQLRQGGEKLELLCYRCKEEAQQKEEIRQQGSNKQHPNWDFGNGFRNNNLAVAGKMDEEVFGFCNDRRLREKRKWDLGLLR